jgi:hypothetical protein
MVLLINETWLVAKGYAQQGIGYEETFSRGNNYEH